MKCQLNCYLPENIIAMIPNKGLKQRQVIRESTKNVGGFLSLAMSRVVLEQTGCECGSIGLYGGASSGYCSAGPVFSVSVPYVDLGGS